MPAAPSRGRTSGPLAPACSSPVRVRTLDPGPGSRPAASAAGGRAARQERLGLRSSAQRPPQVTAACRSGPAPRPLCPGQGSAIRGGFDPFGPRTGHHPGPDRSWLITGRRAVALGQLANPDHPPPPSPYWAQRRRRPPRGRSLERLPAGDGGGQLPVRSTRGSVLSAGFSVPCLAACRPARTLRAPAPRQNQAGPRRASPAARVPALAVVSSQRLTMDRVPIRPAGPAAEILALARRLASFTPQPAPGRSSAQVSLAAPRNGPGWGPGRETRP
jgi:hypothetical protein